MNNGRPTPPLRGPTSGFVILTPLVRPDPHTRSDRISVCLDEQEIAPNRPRGSEPPAHAMPAPARRPKRCPHAPKHRHDGLFPAEVRQLTRQSERQTDAPPRVHNRLHARNAAPTASPK